VSRSEAALIVGQPIANQVEALQGPTCIYRPRGAAAQITLAVQSQQFSTLARQIHDRQRMTIGGRTAYCGTIGAQVLIVAISSHQVLNVTAPCAVAKPLAAKALARLKD
jgi:hypothetical protein